MKYEKGHIVRHPKLGLGKVLNVEGDKVTVFFKDEASNPKVIATNKFPLEILQAQVDPWLDRLDVKLTASGTVKQYLTHEQAVERFLRVFPLGFYDEKYIGDAKTGERHYKMEAHRLWTETLCRQDFERLLGGEEYVEATNRAMQVEAKTNLLSVFEKSALRDAVKGPHAAQDFAGGLFDLIYGQDRFEARFNRFADMLDSLPQPKSAILKWPIQTLFPFLALPKEHLFLKPAVTQLAAERRAFALNYKPQPNWLTYSCLLKFGELLMQDLADLKPRDMIDVQSFIYVTGDDSYPTS